MNAKLTALAALQDGVFTRRDAVRCGYTDAQIRARVRTGEWIRIRRGAYAAAPAGASVGSAVGSGSAWPETAHCQRAVAVLRKLGPTVAASHHTAALLHGLPCFDLDLANVHVLRCDRTQGRRAAGVVQHQAKHEIPVVDVRGTRCVSVARAVVGTAATSGFTAGVVVADAALRARLVTRAELAEVHQCLGRVPGATRAAAVIGFADGRSESVGESRLRVLMDQQGLPAAVPQYEVYDRDGELVARVDFCFPGRRVVIEFDGRVKYRDDAAAVVVREKQREDRLRELGFLVVRVSWDDLADPRGTALRILRALAAR